MAESDVERVPRRKLLPLIGGALLLALLLWGLTQCRGDDVAATSRGRGMPSPAAGPAQPAPAAAGVPIDSAAATIEGATAGAAEAPLPVSAIVGAPANYVGQPVSGTVRVAALGTERGFYVEENGQRLYVVLNEPVATPLRPGQSLRLSGTLFDRSGLSQVPGVVQPADRAIIAGLPLFLFVDAPPEVQSADSAVAR